MRERLLGSLSSTGTSPASSARTGFWCSLLVGALVSFSEPGCSAQPTHATQVNHGATAPKSHTLDSRRCEGKRFGYSWTLPKDWDFVDPGLFWASAPVSAIDVHAAQHSADGPFVLVIATDVIHTVPGYHPGDDPEDYDRLERDGAETLEEANAELTSTTRLQSFGVQTVEVIGEQGKLRISIRSLYVGYRKFEFRCFHLAEPGECDSALRSFLIDELPEPASEHDVPRVRHLRDARFGVAFDAPDDSWLSLGPFVARGGAQVVWTWSKSGRKIDVQVIDLESVPDHVDQTTLATEMARGARASGRRVVEKQVVFAGQLWTHHEMRGKDKSAQDLFILVQEDAMYGILVTQPSRERGLIDAAKQGFRLIARSSPASP